MLSIFVLFKITESPVHRITELLRLEGPLEIIWSSRVS